MSYVCIGVTKTVNYRQVSNISRRCSNCIFILDLTPGFIRLGKDNCKTRRETVRFGDLVRLILETLRYMLLSVRFGNSSREITDVLLPRDTDKIPRRFTCSNIQDRWCFHKVAYTFHQRIRTHLGVQTPTLHDDVIKWKHFPRNWPFVRGIDRSWWIPHTKASDAELWCFLWSASE